MKKTVFVPKCNTDFYSVNSDVMFRNALYRITCVYSHIGRFVKLSHVKKEIE